LGATEGQKAEGRRQKVALRPLPSAFCLLPSAVSRFLGPVVALASLLIYSRTLAPSLGGTIDSAEFQQATYSLGVVHPTGYPLYLLLGRAWIALYPFGDPAFRINLLSAIFAALAVWVLYATVLHLTGNLPASLAASALFAVQAIPWAQAGVAEINTLNTLLTGLAFRTVLLWATGRLPVYVPALAYGLAVSHHRTALLYLPVLLVFGLLALRRGTPRRSSAQQVALVALLLVLPFLLYLYIPLRGFTTDWYANDWQSFWAEVFGESALPVIGGALGRAGLPRLRSLLFGPIFTGVPGYALLLLGLLGGALAILSARRRQKAPDEEPLSAFRPLPSASGFLLYAAAFVVGLAFAMIYDILDVEDYLAVPVFMWCVLAGGGVAAILALTGSSRLRLPAATRMVLRASLCTAIVGLVLLTGYRSLQRTDPRVDFSNFDRRPFWADVVSTSGQMPAGAILICDWTESNEAKYLQQVGGWRPDLKVIVADTLLGGDGLQIDRWLAEKRPVYLLGDQASILARYSAEALGPLSKITGRQAATDVPVMTHPLNRRYGGDILLVGYTLQPEPPRLSPGGLLKLTLFWKATGPVSERYVVFNHVIDAEGGKVGQLDGEPGGGTAPTVDWKPGGIVTDSFPISIGAQTAPGSYRLMTGLYTRLGQRRLTAFAQDGTPLGDYPELAAVIVK
jgi:hypothetical protein